MKKVYKGIFAFVFFYLMNFTISLIFGILKKINIITINNSTAIYITFIADFIIALVLLTLYYKEIKEEVLIFKNKFWESIDVAFKYWGLGLIIMIISNLLINMIFKITPGNQEVVNKMTDINPLLMIILAGVIAPIEEELVFRKGIGDVFKNTWIFIFMSGFIFGLLHVVGSYRSIVDLLFIIPYGALGACFAYVYRKTGTIFSTIFIHMFHNILVTLLQMFI